MSKEVIEALAKLTTGAICALGLVGALFIIYSQNEVLKELMERQTAALEVIAATYSGKSAL